MAGKAQLCPSGLDDHFGALSQKDAPIHVKLAFTRCLAHIQPQSARCYEPNNPEMQIEHEQPMCAATISSGTVMQGRLRDLQHCSFLTAAKRYELKARCSDAGAQLQFEFSTNFPLFSLLFPFRLPQQKSPSALPPTSLCEHDPHNLTHIPLPPVTSIVIPFT